MNIQDYYRKKIKAEDATETNNNKESVAESKTVEPNKNITFSDVLSKSWLMLIPGAILAFFTAGMLQILTGASGGLMVLTFILLTPIFALALGCYRVYGAETVEVIEKDGTVKLKKKNKYTVYLWLFIFIFAVATFTVFSSTPSTVLMDEGPVTHSIGTTTVDTGTDASTSQQAQNNTATQATTSTNSTTATTNDTLFQKPEVSYGPGTLKVGVDIPAGEYVAIDYSYIEITSDSSGEFESILDNESSGIYGYVRLYDGEYVTINRGFLVPIDSIPALNSSTYTSGVFLIGRDIPAGEYQVTTSGSGSGYWERNSQPIGSDNSVYTIIANENFEDSTYVTVEDGEYLTLSGNAALNINQ